MPKQRTYTGTKKAQSMARQGRRNKTMGSGGNVNAGQKQQQETKAGNAFIAPGIGKRILSNLAYKFAALIGLAIVLYVTGAFDNDGTSRTISLPIVIGGAIIIVALVAWDIWRKKKNGRLGKGDGMFR